MRMATPAVLALDHRTRHRIYEHLQILPGDHFRSVARAAGVGVGTARHHLRILVRDGIIYEEKREGRSRYYTAGDELQRERNELFGKHWSYRETRLRIWTVLNRLQESTAARIAHVLGISRQLAAYHMIWFERQGVLSRTRGLYRIVVPARALWVRSDATDSERPVRIPEDLSPGGISQGLGLSCRGSPPASRAAGSGRPAR